MQAHWLIYDAFAHSVICLIRMCSNGLMVQVEVFIRV